MAPHQAIGSPGQPRPADGGFEEDVLGHEGEHSGYRPSPLAAFGPQPPPMRQHWREGTARRRASGGGGKPRSRPRSPPPPPKGSSSPGLTATPAGSHLP